MYEDISWLLMVSGAYVGIGILVTAIAEAYFRFMENDEDNFILGLVALVWPVVAMGIALYTIGMVTSSIIRTVAYISHILRAKQTWESEDDFYHFPGPHDDVSSA